MSKEKFIKDLSKNINDIRIQGEILNLESDTLIRNFINDMIEQGVNAREEILENFDMLQHEQQIYMKVRAEYLVSIILASLEAEQSEDELLN